MKKCVLASGNKHKLKEIKEIMQEFNIELTTMADEGLGDLEIVEDGDTFEKNSYIKAKEVMDRLNVATIADDSGLMVDYLDGRPGVYSARYAGKDATYLDNNKKLIKELKGVSKEKRGAKFVTVITLLTPEGEKIVARGEILGKIGFEPKGKKGFGYDPLFIVKGKNKTFAQMDSKEKNKISHRAKALEALKVKLKNFLR